MTPSRSRLWFEAPLLGALALATGLYIATVLAGGVQGEYLGQPAVLALFLGALLARWRSGLGWLMVILSLVATATLLFILAEGNLYPDGVPSLDQPRGDLTRLGDFRPVFLLQLVAMVAAIGASTFLVRRVTRRRFTIVVGTVLIVATSALGAATFMTGDWVTYERSVTLPTYPWAFGWPVYALLTIAGLSWVAGLARGIRLRAIAAPRNERGSTIKDALLVELVPAFAGAQLAGAATERAWLATELHATVLPAIRSAVEIVGPSGTSQADVRSRLTELEVELRRIADGKRSILLDEFGLVEAIEWLVERVQSDYRIPVELQVQGETDLGRPPDRVERVTFDICRLALDNAARHSGTNEIRVVVGTAQDRIHLEVADDGRGLAPGEVETAMRAGRHGLPDMYEAARSVSGRLVVQAEAGTRVIFEWHKG